MPGINASNSPTESDLAQTECWIQVALDVPLTGPFEYRCTEPCQRGVRVIVPFGKRKLIGMVLSVGQTPSLEPKQIRDVIRVLNDVATMPESWMALAEFAANYYHRPLGEVIIPALPAHLRQPSAYLGVRSGDGPIARLQVRLAREQKKREKAAQAQADAATVGASAEADESHSSTPVRELTPDQSVAVDAIACAQGFQTFLLFGVTGAGKTEVYLQAAKQVLSRGGAVLFLVPEINLTPQFEDMLRERLGEHVGAGKIARLHSGLSEGERLKAWVSVVRGEARVVLGTRLAIFAPMPKIDLIVVDEEHDPSYKQQEGLRYSARDLAVWRARQFDIPIVLGSATPSLESWWHAEQGRYQLLTLTSRASAVELPEVRLVDTRRQPLEQGLSPHALKAMQETLAEGRQVLVYLNRRGYAPVLHCASCGWVSECTHCSVYTVLHKVRGFMRLHCHHCGSQRPVVRRCPDCGDQDLQPMGRGTQRLDEHLQTLFSDRHIVRIDADSTRRKGAAQALFDQVHTGEADILVGTQMVSKGHDFDNLGLVVVLNPDTALFSQDFRAPERLFAQLVQVAGRAGRRARQGEVLVQTDYPDHEVYLALRAHDYPGFASSQLAQREAAGLPPFSYHALLSAQARELPAALSFLENARTLAMEWLSHYQDQIQVTLYDAVALRVIKVAGQCRAQLLVESASRAQLQAFIRHWLDLLGSRHAPGGVRWQLEIDPLEI